MYYEDLQEYKFGMKAIGWLDKNHDYTKGEVSKDIIDKLKSVKPRFLTCGHHVCEFCFPDGHKGGYGEIKDAISSYEIHICSKKGQVYVAPAMIIHYMAKHNYLPPQEYIDAVLTGYTTNDSQYNYVIHETMEKMKAYLLDRMEKHKKEKNV